MKIEFAENKLIAHFEDSDAVAFSFAMGVNAVIVYENDAKTADVTAVTEGRMGYYMAILGGSLDRVDFIEDYLLPKLL